MPKYSFQLNGKTVEVDAPSDLSVLWALRDKLGVTGPKYGCGIQVCFACTSHLDGEAFNPCVTNLEDVDGREVTTIEGLADGDVLHPVQEAWLEQDVAQCGYCQPGQIMAAAAMLTRTKNPTDADIDAIENVCRCGTYFRVRAAIKSAAEKIAARAAAPVIVPAAAPANGASGTGGSGTSGSGADGAGGSTVLTSGGTLPTTGLGAGAAAAGVAALAAAAGLRAVRHDGEAAEPA